LFGYQKERGRNNLRRKRSLFQKLSTSIFNQFLQNTNSDKNIAVTSEVLNVPDGKTEGKASFIAS
jgi:hypothetical protein